jgi:glycerol-1-phosphate dehydrogenase [NAD(P)+]
MTRIVRNVSIPVFFVVEEGVVKALPQIIERENLLFKRFILVSGPTFTKKVADIVEGILQGKIAGRVMVRSNKFEEVENLKREIETIKPDAVLAVGGGRVIDVVKVASGERMVPFLSIPTSLSNDGIASPVAVIRYSKNVKSIGAQVPLGVIVDLEYVKSAPRESILSGIGDLIANLSAVEDWKLAEKYKGEKIDPFAEVLSRTAAERFVYFVMEQDRVDFKDTRFLKSLAEGLILSGVAMAIAGTSRPASGAEHLISHALDEILDEPLPHGIQVGISTLYIMELRGKEVKPLREFFDRVNFPKNPEEVGISTETFIRAVERAPSTRPERFTLFNLKFP